MFIKSTIIYLTLFIILINGNNEEQIKSASADSEISTKELVPKLGLWGLQQQQPPIGGGLGLIGNGLLPQQQPFNLPSFPPQQNPFINNFYQPPPFNNYFLRSPYFIPPQTNPFFPYQNFPLFNSGIGNIPQYPPYQSQFPLGGPQLPLGGLPGGLPNQLNPAGIV